MHREDFVSLTLTSICDNFQFAGAVFGGQIYLLLLVGIYVNTQNSLFKNIMRVINNDTLLMYFTLKTLRTRRRTPRVCVLKWVPIKKTVYQENKKSGKLYDE